MAEHSRRTFLRRASIGAATIGAASVAPSLLGGANADAEPVLAGPVHDGHFVILVKDAQAGEFSVLVGEQTVVFTDKKLARRLGQLASKANATGSASSAVKG